MISLLIIGIGLLLSCCGAVLVVYSKDGSQETLGGALVLISLIIVAIGGLARVAGY
jgi:hypothetical protein